jgi:hypothetical protein
MSRTSKSSPALLGSSDIQSLADLNNSFAIVREITGTLPYGVARLQGMVTGAPTEAKIYRSGLLDATFRFSVNLKGGPAMSVNAL